MAVDRTGSHAVWIMKLQSTYNKICQALGNGNEYICNNYRIDGKTLRVPGFRICQMSGKWGTWSPSEKFISLHEDLFLRFEWGAVEQVLKHEMAHQIDGDIWDLDFRGHVHGEAFKRACKLLDCDDSRTTSSEMLAGFKGTEESPIVDKVRKLLVKGNDTAVTEAES